MPERPARNQPRGLLFPILSLRNDIEHPLYNPEHQPIAAPLVPPQEEYPLLPRSETRIQIGTLEPRPHLAAALNDLNRRRTTRLTRHIPVQDQEVNTGQNTTPVRAQL